MDKMISWFEIPVTNMERARRFYSDIFDIQMETQHMSGTDMAFFPQNMLVSGALCKGDGYVPTDQGTLIYMNGGKDLSEVLMRIENAGGRIMVPKTQITPEYGYMAIFTDTEGNKLALHSQE
jgi:uncharacterized protein